MRTNRVNNNSFKATYLIKGHTDLLDEICWYLQKKHVQNEAFSFVDIRNGIWFPGEISPLKHEAVDLFMTEDDEKLITPKLPELVQESMIENFGTKISEYYPDNSRQATKEILTENIRNVAYGEEMPLKKSSGGRTINDFARLLADNLKEMMQRFEKGNAIVNIHHDLVKKFHPTLRIVTPEALDGEEVFAGVQRGTFDYTEGVFA